MPFHRNDQHPRRQYAYIHLSTANYIYQNVGTLDPYTIAIVLFGYVKSYQSSRPCKNILSACFDLFACPKEGAFNYIIAHQDGAINPQNR